MNDRSFRNGPQPFRSSTARCRGRLLGSSLLAGAILLTSAGNVPAAPTCKPILSIRKMVEVRYSMMPILPYRWMAKLVADARHCATRSGQFEIDFIRIKENAPDMQFTERFRWTAGQFDVSIELTADEAVFDYRIGFIAPCVCRDFPFGE